MQWAGVCCVRGVRGGLGAGWGGGWMGGNSSNSRRAERGGEEGEGEAVASEAKQRVRRVCLCVGGQRGGACVCGG